MSPPKVALVTGASSGIGKATSLALMKAGFHVVLAARSADKLAEVAARAQGMGVRAIAVATDVTDPASVRALFAESSDSFGRLDVLFNNAGVSAPAVDIDELAFEDWKKVIDTNLTGAFLCTQAAFALMKRQDPRGGRIINNGSISAYAPRPNSAPYTSSKHAITGLTKSTALDGRKYDIACGQIDIGNADTDMAGRMKVGIPQADGSIRAEPVMDPGHVADAVVMMAQLPLTSNVLSMTIMATKMPFVGRG
jgi:NAD(P)-dependent dehydrogenase (short-subunit alcohol dehydrogenase family)